MVLHPGGNSRVTEALLLVPHAPRVRSRATELGFLSLSLDALPTRGLDGTGSIFVQLIFHACRGGILHLAPLMYMVHRHTIASLGENDRTWMLCGARRRHEP